MKDQKLTAQLKFSNTLAKKASKRFNAPRNDNEYAVIAFMFLNDYEVDSEVFVLECAWTEPSTFLKVDQVKNSVVLVPAPKDEVTEPPTCTIDIVNRKMILLSEADDADDMVDDDTVDEPTPSADAPAPTEVNALDNDVSLTPTEINAPAPTETLAPTEVTTPAHPEPMEIKNEPILLTSDEEILRQILAATFELEVFMDVEKFKLIKHNLSLVTVDAMKVALIDFKPELPLTVQTRALFGKLRNNKTIRFGELLARTPVILSMQESNSLIAPIKAVLLKVDGNAILLPLASIKDESIEANVFYDLNDAPLIETPANYYEPFNGPTSDVVPVPQPIPVAQPGLNNPNMELVGRQLDGLQTGFDEFGVPSFTPATPTLTPTPGLFNEMDEQGYKQPPVSNVGFIPNQPLDRLMWQEPVVIKLSDGSETTIQIDPLPSGLKVVSFKFNGETFTVKPVKKEKKKNPLNDPDRVSLLDL